MTPWYKLLGLPEPAPRGTSAASPGSEEFTYSAFDDLQPEYEHYHVPHQVVVVLRPKEPYLRWVQQSRDRDLAALLRVPECAEVLNAGPIKKFTLAQLRNLCTAYLVDLHDNQNLTAREQVERDFLFFFTFELEQVETVEDGNWPSHLTLNLFRQWFDIESFDTVLDTTKV